MSKTKILKDAYSSAALEGVSRSQFNACVEAFLTEVSKSLSESNRVQIRGFGSFYVKEYPARAVRNPATGETLKIGPRSKVKFKPSNRVMSYGSAIQESDR